MAKKYYGSVRKGGMINDDYSAAAHLPTGVMEKSYEESYGGMYGYSGGTIPDLYTGVSKQLKEDVAGLKKVMGPSKY